MERAQQSPPRRIRAGRDGSVDPECAYSLTPRSTLPLQTLALRGRRPYRERPAAGGPMGENVTSTTFTREDRMRYRQKVRRCLDVFALMLDDFAFEANAPMTGLELEINLVDHD